MELAHFQLDDAQHGHAVLPVLCPVSCASIPSFIPGSDGLLQHFKLQLSHVERTIDHRERHLLLAPPESLWTLEIDCLYSKIG